MGQRNALLAGFGVLRGLWSNKTTWHPDRDHFLEYNNLENAGEFKHLRRGGSHVVGSVNVGGSDYSTKMPRTGTDFSYIDTTDQGATFSKKLAVMLGNYSMYTATTGAISSYNSSFPTQNDSVQYSADPSAIVFKNRLIWCTSARPSLAAGVSMNFKVAGLAAGHMRFSGGVSDIAWKYPRGSILISEGGRYIVKGMRILQPSSYSRTAGGTVTVTFPSAHNLISGQQVNLRGCPTATINGVKTVATPTGSTVTFADAAGLIGTTTWMSGRIEDYRTLEMKQAYGAVALSPSNKNAYGNRNGNLLIFDPNDTRGGASKISEAGAIAPATQVTLTPYYYYHETGGSTSGWVWVGNTAGVATTCTMTSGDATVAFGEAIPTGVAKGDFFYFDDAEFEILSVAADRKSIETRMASSSGTSDAYDGVGEIVTVLPENNLIGLSSHRWAIFYGKLNCMVGYNYSYAYYNSLSGHLSNRAPVTLVMESHKHFNFKITNWEDLGGTNAVNNPKHYDTIIFFRSADGGLPMFEVQRISSTLASGPNDIVDSVIDSALGSITAPTAFNAPPPLFHMIAEYQGRLWGIDAIERNKIWFSADEGQIATIDEDGMGVGRAEECFPVTNYIVIPSAGGMAHTIVKAGDYLFVGTEYGLFVVVGTNELNYSFEHVFGEDGVYPGAITEYQGPLSRGTPGAFFITNGMRAFVIAPGLGKYEIGMRVADKLVTFAELFEDARNLKIHVEHVNASAKSENLSVGGTNYRSYKDRDYILVHGFKDEGTAYSEMKCLVYDITMDAWYYHTQEHGAAGALATTPLAQCPLVFRSSIFGLPIIFGGYIDLNLGTSYFRLVCLYNDLLSKDCNQSYGGRLRSSYLDFKARKDIKSLDKVKLFTPASGTFTVGLYKDESPTQHTLDNYTLATEGDNLQEANGKEKTLYLMENAGFIQGHTFSLAVNFPEEAGCNVEYVQFEYQVLARPE